MKRSGQPFVVLKDCLKEESKGNDESMGSRKDFTPDFPTPPPSTSSSVSGSGKKRRRQKRERSWDPNLEYEIQKVVGYYRDKKKRMWYLIKWKGWSDEYNTFERIENLTGCNYRLMKYFECEKPTGVAISKKKKEIKESLKDHAIYQRLVRRGFKAEDLREFSERCLNIDPLFEKDGLKTFANEVRREYSYIVRCLIAMCFHQDPGLFLRAQNYNVCLRLVNLRKKQLVMNSLYEISINRLEKTPIAIENHVDLEIFPKDLEYVVELKAQEGIVLLQEPVVGCDCPNGCTPKSNCCGVMAGSQFAYTARGKLKSSYPTPIYECNARCGCPDTCPNRVVQKGRKIRLCIFRTKACGWGVKSLEDIERGSFVCEYLGELIRDSEAVVRDVVYCKKNLSYLFDLDFNSAESPAQYCIDSTTVGNIARFINHSCDPNLVVRPLWVDWLDPNLHRLAFFARRDIKKNEEIYFDYLNEGTLLSPKGFNGKSHGAGMISKIRCMCQSAECRQWIFGK